MSHKNIIQVSKMPIPNCEFIGEDFFYDTAFLSAIADSVEVSSRKEAMSQLHKIPGIQVKREGKNTFLEITSKIDYFRVKYQDAMAAAKSFQSVSITDFCKESNAGNYEFHIRNAYIDEFGIYVVKGNDMEPTPLDTFVRDSNDGDKYYIGSVFSYHY